MKKSLLFWLLGIMLGMTQVLAQSRTISGVVTDADDGQPLIGVNVLVKGTTNGAVTDIDGKYSISGAPAEGVLVVSYVGYATLEVSLTPSNVLNVSLRPGVELDETIVVGYTTVNRKDLTGSVAKVSGAEIQSIPNVTVEKALQGRAAGVTVVQNSGTPGAGIDVRVRGTTSLSAGTQPLYVIDGVPVININAAREDLGGQGANSLAQLNPNDIESIEVLKDAATAAIYGARAANGVVLITTKKGKYSEDGRATIQLNTSYGVQRAWKKLKTLNNEQYYSVLADGFSNAFGLPSDMTDAEVLEAVEWDISPDKYTNYVDYIFDRGSLQDHNISVSGGNAKTKYFGSLGYFQNKGIMRATQYDRYSGRLNLESKLKERFKIGANMGFNSSVEKRVPNDNNIYGYMLPALLNNPDANMYNEDGTYAVLLFGNPASLANEYINTIKTNRFTGNAFAELNLAKGLSLRSTFGADVLDSREKVYESVYTYAGAGSNGRAMAATVNYTSWINENLLLYNNTFGKHHLNGVLGLSFQQDRQYRVLAEGTNAASPDLSNLETTAIPVTATSDGTVFGLRSYFTNINYSYGNRYLATFTFRTDASSRFPQGNQYAHFPGFSLAWRINEEAFLSGAKPKLSDLKIKGGFGTTGNQGIGNFASRGLFGSKQFADAIGVFPTQMTNVDLKWEVTKQWNLGLDLGLFNDRIHIGAEYYQRRTDNMLLNRPYASQAGFFTRLENIGDIENKGWELTINTHNIKGKFNWKTSINLSQNRNKVLKLTDGKDMFFGFSSSTIVREGEAVGTFFGWKTAGLFQSVEEIEALNATSPTGVYQYAGTAPGDIKFVDVNGDGVINDDDRTIIGSAQPKLFGGFNNNFSWKGLELDVFFQFSYGNKIFNANRQFTEGMNSVFNQTEGVLNRWTPENTNTSTPRAVYGDPNNNTRNSDFYAEDGSYLRLKNITLAYNLPTNKMGAFGKYVQGLRLYVTAANLVTFTKYSGFDPEVNMFDGSAAVLGTDFGTYPQARSFVFGANFTF